MNKKSFIYIIAAGILWATSGIFVKAMTPYGFSPLQITALRGLISFLCIAVYTLIRDRKKFIIRRGELILYVFSGLSMFGTAGFYFLAMQMTSISTAVVLMYTAPILVMIFSVSFLGERFSLGKLISIISVSIGCCLVSGIIGDLKINVLGIAIGLLSGISYAAYNIFTRIEMQKGYSPLSSTLYGSLFMSVIAICVSNPAEIVTITASDPIEILPLIIALGVVTFVLPYLLYSAALRDIPAGTASSLAIIEPMTATLFGIIIYHEPIDLFSGVGVVMILLAIVILSREKE